MRVTIGVWGLVELRAESLDFRYDLTITDQSIVTSIILLGSGFGDHLGVRVIGETLKQNLPTLGNQKSSSPRPKF